MPEQTIEQELEQAQQILNNWNLHASEIARVRQLEMGTMMTPKIDLMQGYYADKAVQGYQQIINAYALIGNVTAEQREGLEKVSQVLGGLQDEERMLGRKPDSYTSARFCNMKLQELDGKGSMYMLSGHARHFNIVKITKQPNGGYSYTRYDAGHESKVIDWKGDRPVIQAVQEFTIKPGTDIRRLLETELAKKDIDPNSAEYATAKNAIDGMLKNPPIRAELEYGQRKGNCTTRGQRIMASDILQDTGLSEGLYDFASNVNGTTTDDIRQALQARVNHLTNLKACGADSFCRSMDVDTFLKAADPRSFEERMVGLDGGGLTHAYRTLPGRFTEPQLKSLQETLERNGMKSNLRESVTSPGQFYLYVPPEEGPKIRATLARDQSLVGEAFRKTGDNAKAYLEVRSFVKMSDPYNYESAILPGNLPAYRTTPGVFSAGELDTLKETLQRNGVPAEIRASTRDPGKIYLFVPQEKAQDIGKALQHDKSQAAELYRHYGESAHKYVDDINLPDLPPKPPVAMDIISDASRWQAATRADNGAPIIRLALGDMKEAQILTLENELVKNGFRPVRHESNTMGPTLRLEGDEVARLRKWQADILNPPATGAKPGFISNFLQKIMGQRIIDVGGDAPSTSKKHGAAKPG
jgi:hypothetical protein